MAPVSPEGFGVVRTFVAWMIGGAVAALVLLLGTFVVPFLWVAAPIAFIACAAYGGWYFISQAQSRGDHNHTVDDYQSGRVTNPTT